MMKPFSNRFPQGKPIKYSQFSSKEPLMFKGFHSLEEIEGAYESGLIKRPVMLAGAFNLADVEADLHQTVVTKGIFNLADLECYLHEPVMIKGTFNLADVESRLHEANSYERGMLEDSVSSASSSTLIVKGVHALNELEGRASLPRPYLWYDRTILDEEEQSKIQLLLEKLEAASSLSRFVNKQNTK